MSSDYWSSLPPELLEKISRKLLAHSDYVRFRAVCTAWRISTPEIPTHLPCQLPWLMLAQSHYNSHRRTFLTLPNNRLHYLNLPEASYPRRRCGSSHGWLTIVEESPTIFLVNPLTRAKINLPPLTTFPNVVSFDFSNIGREYVLRTLQNNRYYTASLREMRDDFIKKIVLSNSPSRGCYFVAVAIIRIQEELQLAYCKSDQNSWKFIEGVGNFAEDVTFFNGLIYSVHEEGDMAVCDVSGDSPTVEIIGTLNLNVSVGGNMLYLVNAMDELLLVARFLEFEVVGEEDQLRCITTSFKVFRYDFSGINWEWWMSLGDKVLFLGENSSLAFSASDYLGLRGNRIYFTDDFSKEDSEDLYGDPDVGIFNLEDGTIETLPCYLPSGDPLRWPPLVWVTPNPCS